MPCLGCPLILRFENPGRVSHATHLTCKSSRLRRSNLTRVIWLATDSYLASQMDASTFGNDCILSSFFSFILTSNKSVQVTVRSITSSQGSHCTSTLDAILCGPQGEIWQELPMKALFATMTPQVRTLKIENTCMLTHTCAISVTPSGGHLCHA